MAHRLAPRAEADPDDIWLYVAKESAGMDVATRLRRARDEDFGAGSRSFAVGEHIIAYCVEGADV
jgi:hypothetical protein